MKIKIQDLFLLIESPDSNEILVNEPSITIVGTTRVDAMVTVNDKIPMLDIDGRFQQEIELDPGANIIEVIASLADGEEKSMVLAVIYVR